MLIKKIQIGLKKTSSILSLNILNTLSSKKINQETLDELESILLSADIGIDVTNQLIEKIKTFKIVNSEDSKEIIKVLANELVNFLKAQKGQPTPKFALSKIIFL